MREILFRGKSVEDGKWLEGSLLCFPNGELAICCEKGETEDYFHYDIYKVYPDSVGQYIGIKDAKGNRIFEGDIIRYAEREEYACYLESLEFPEEYENEVYDCGLKESSIKYHIEDDYPAFDLAEHEFESNGLSALIAEDYYFEIVGNIYIKGQK